ncbi:hypothetical protein SLS63_006600 [Diaporthe eres]|uniref:Uncharacterized protein n=1 Tax=Diaporthe eres TaxID=83184 RepID=A0ABR1P7H4_DIAER
MIAPQQRVTRPLSKTTTPTVAALYLPQAVEDGAHHAAVARHQVVRNSYVAARHRPASGDASTPAAVHVPAPAAPRHEDDSVVVVDREIRAIIHFLSGTDRAQAAPSQATRATGHLPASTPSYGLIWPASWTRQAAVSERVRPSVYRHWSIATTRRKRKNGHDAMAVRKRVEETDCLDFQGNPCGPLPIKLTRPNLSQRRALSIKIRKAVTRETRHITLTTRASPTLRNDESRSMSLLLKSWSPELDVLPDRQKARPGSRPVKTSITANLEWDVVGTLPARTRE